MNQDNKRYYTFIRSCTGWQSFARARKSWRGRYLTEQGALEACDNYNNSRNARQIRNGTKMEYTSDPPRHAR